MQYTITSSILLDTFFFLTFNVRFLKESFPLCEKYEDCLCSFVHLSLTSFTDAESQPGMPG